MSTFFFRVFEHLLPRSRVWQMKVASVLREFFMGLSSLPQAARDFIDQVYLDLYPADTRELGEWENQFGLPDASLTEQQRRDRYAAAWLRAGGQSPRYLQDLIQANGFADVYVHEWWEVPPGTPPVARNPNTYLEDGSPVFVCEADELKAHAGEVQAEAGNPIGALGYLLVNKVKTYTVIPLGCDDVVMECDEVKALCGEPLSEVFGQIDYVIPSDPLLWPYVLYFGGATFPNQATVPAARREEFENLLLSICPGQQWLGVLVTYA